MTEKENEIPSKILSVVKFLDIKCSVVLSALVCIVKLYIVDGAALDTQKITIISAVYCYMSWAIQTNPSKCLYVLLGSTFLCVVHISFLEQLSIVPC